MLLLFWRRRRGSTFSRRSPYEAAMTSSTLRAFHLFLSKAKPVATQTKQKMLNESGPNQLHRLTTPPKTWTRDRFFILNTKKTLMCFQWPPLTALLRAWEFSGEAFPPVMSCNRKISSCKCIDNTDVPVVDSTCWWTRILALGLFLLAITALGQRNRPAGLRIRPLWRLLFMIKTNQIIFVGQVTWISSTATWNSYWDSSGRWLSTTKSGDRNSRPKSSCWHGSRYVAVYGVLRRPFRSIFVFAAFVLAIGFDKFWFLLFYLLLLKNDCVEASSFA